MICKTDECNNNTSLSNAPKEIFCITIPFTKLEIMLWNWNNKEYNEYCDDCINEIEHTKERYLYEQAYDDGARNCYEKILRAEGVDV